MTDEQKQEQDASQDTPETSAETENTDQEQPKQHLIPKSRFDEVNQRYKQSAAELAKLKQEKEQREQAEALARGEHEQVINQLREQLAAAQQTAETNASYKEALMQSVQTRIEAIPENMRSLVPLGLVDDPVKLANWLDANAALLQRPVAPNLDAGIVGDKKPTPKLTPEQQSMARLFGLSDEQYAADLDASAIPFDILHGKRKP